MGALRCLCPNAMSLSSASTQTTRYFSNSRFCSMMYRTNASRSSLLGAFLGSYSIWRTDDSTMSFLEYWTTRLAMRSSSTTRFRNASVASTSNSSLSGAPPSSKNSSRSRVDAVMSLLTNVSSTSRIARSNGTLTSYDMMELSDGLPRLMMGAAAAAAADDDAYDDDDGSAVGPRDAFGCCPCDGA